MIAVTRTAEPACLTQNAAQWTQELCAERLAYHQQSATYAQNPVGKPPTKPRAKSNRYGHDDVKMALADMFGEKCCYCEAWVEHVAPRHVEHFRPASVYPTLAYKWNNLLYACFSCNSRHKKDLFPLAPHEQTPQEDATNPGSRDDTDDALLIDPCRENPANYLGFNGANIVAKDDPTTNLPHRKGVKTIEVCGLDRSKLTRHRRKCLRSLTPVLEAYLTAKASGDPVKIQKYASELLEFCHPEEEYAGMFRAELARNGIDWRTL
jgi:uncharacterized protein (TIGR02646 family)